MSVERRATIRHRVLKGGRIVTNAGYSTYDCTVRSLSDGGARLKIASSVGVPDSFELVMDDGRKFDCQVAWRTALEIGAKFI